MSAVIGIGVDVVDIGRLRRALDRRPALAERVFTAGERAVAGAASNPGRHLAARFAAKEAVFKALGVGMGGVGWREVEVVRTTGGAPVVKLAGRAAELARDRGVNRWHLSLSHTDDVAVASVVAEREM